MIKTKPTLVVCPHPTLILAVIVGILTIIFTFIIASFIWNPDKREKLGLKYNYPFGFYQGIFLYAIFHFGPNQLEKARNRSTTCSLMPIGIKDKLTSWIALLKTGMNLLGIDWCLSQAIGMMGSFCLTIL